MKKLALTLIILFPIIVKAQSYDVNGDFKISGNVGIGTSSPNFKLHINSPDNQLMRFTSTNGTWLDFESTNATIGNRIWSIGHVGTSNKFAVYQRDGTDQYRFLIDENGNIGIGTTSPEAELHVEGQFRSIQNSSGNALGIYLSNDNTSNNNSNSIYFGSKDTSGDRDNGAVIKTIFSEHSGTGVTGNLVFETANNADNPTERLRITGEGKVGIGTSTPSAKLDINGNIHMNGGLLQFYRSYENYGNVMVLRTKDNNNYGDFRFEAERTDDSSLQQLMFLDGGKGGLGIGTESIPQGFKLAVDGKGVFEEVKIQLSEQWPDFVFNDNYNLPTLEEVENYISANKHLPEIPSEAEVTENGINLGEMNAKLLQKIEELTLYLIEQNKEIRELKELTAQQQAEIEQLKKE